MSARILITGGAGFVGSNLARAFLKRGASVVVVDNFITGQRVHAQQLTHFPKCTVIEADIASDDFLQVSRHFRFAEVYHLACPTGVPNIERFGEEMLMSCSAGTRNVLDVARTSHAALLFTSSCEAYGQPLTFPQTEDYHGNVATTGPRSAYEEGKRFSEALVSLYVRKYSLNAKIVRIFNAYGQGMSLDDQRVIPRFLKSIIEGRAVVIYGDGSQQRTFIHVDDLIKGLGIVMQKGERGEIYNLGGEDVISIRTLAALVFELMGSAPRITYEPHFIEDHRARKPSVEKIRALGWMPLVSLRDGIASMLSFYDVRRVKPFASVFERQVEPISGELLTTT